MSLPFRALRHFILKSSGFKFPSTSRSIHLLYAATAHSPLGNHKVKDFTCVPDIYIKQGRTNLKTLDDTWEEVDVPGVVEKVEPGIALLPTRNIENIELLKVAEQFPSVPDYELHEIKESTRSFKPNTKGRKSKEIHISTTFEKVTFYTRMERASQLLNAGFPVEVHIRAKGGKEAFPWDWAMKHCLHLRPDVITKAMPEGTVMAISPRTDGKTIAWVMLKLRPGTNVPPWDRYLDGQRKIQFTLDRKGLGMPTREERKQAKREALAVGEQIPNWSEKQKELSKFMASYKRKDRVKISTSAAMVRDSRTEAMILRKSKKKTRAKAGTKGGTKAGKEGSKRGPPKRDALFKSSPFKGKTAVKPSSFSKSE